MKTAETNGVECDSEVVQNADNRPGKGDSAGKRKKSESGNDVFDDSTNRNIQSEAEQEDIEREENEGGPVL
jgi:hypothetical protein